MIRAKFSAEGGSIVLALTGHAGQAKKGRDILCASASMLAYTVAQTIRFMFEEDKLAQAPRIRLESGDAYIEAVPKQEHYAEALHTFFVGQVGYHLLSHNYPQVVELTSFGKSL